MAGAGSCDTETMDMNEFMQETHIEKGSLGKGLNWELGIQCLGSDFRRSLLYVGPVFVL